MRSLSPPSSTSGTAGRETQLPSSSSSLSPRLSLQSPELQSQFLQECRNKFQSPSEPSESSEPSVVSSPFSPPPSSSPWSSSSSSSSPSYGSRPARLSLSSPELLSELRESRTRPLRHVPTHNGLTTVFSGRGGRQVGEEDRARGFQASGPALSTGSANQMTSH